MADNWAPGQAGYTSPYAKDFNPDSSGFKISMRKKQGFNWDYGSYGIMDNGGVTSQDQWGSGSTARSSGPGTNLGTGRVDIRNVGTPAEFDPSRNFKTLRNASYTTGRGFMKAAKGFGKMANGLMANNANRLNTKLANAQQAQQEAQEAQVQKQQASARKGSAAVRQQMDPMGRGKDPYDMLQYPTQQPPARPAYGPTDMDNTRSGLDQLQDQLNKTAAHNRRQGRPKTDPQTGEYNW
jgi:hypothetical protein